MTVHLTIALEEKDKAQLQTIADFRKQSVDAVVSDALRELIEYDTWFRAEATKGLASIDAGRAVPHEDVVDRARQRRLARRRSDT
jgi:predicted transcriptional regulator